MSRKQTASSCSAEGNRLEVPDDVSMEAAMKRATRSYDQAFQSPRFVNSYEFQKEVSALQAVMITDALRREEHAETQVKLERINENLECLKRGHNMTERELLEAAKKKRRMREATADSPSLVDKLVQTKAAPNGRSEVKTILVTGHLFTRERDVEVSWVEGPLATMSSETGLWSADADGPKQRLKRTSVKVLDTALDRREGTEEEEAEALATVPATESSCEGMRAKVLPGAQSRGAKFEAWVLQQLPIGFVRKFHAPVKAAKGRKSVPACYSVEFRLLGSELSQKNGRLLGDEAAQLVTLKINPEGLQMLGREDTAPVSTVTELKDATRLQRPLPGQKVRCVRRIKDRAVHRCYRFDAKVSDKTSDKHCAYFHDPKKGDCIRVILDEGDNARMAEFPRHPEEFYFEGVLPDDHPLLNDAQKLAGVPEAAKAFQSTAAGAQPPPQPFDLDRLQMVAVKSTALAQDPTLELGWGKLAIKVLEQTNNRGAPQLLVEVPFTTLRSYIVQMPAKNLRRLEEEAQPNPDSIRRRFQPERFEVGDKLVMRLKFPKGEPSVVENVSCRVLGYNDTVKNKPRWTLAIPGAHAEFRLTLPVDASSFDNGEGEGRVTALAEDAALPANDQATLEALTDYILWKKGGHMVHKENKLALRVPQGGAKPPKEVTSLIDNLQATHADLDEDIAPADRKCKLVFHYPNDKCYRRQVPRAWLGKFLFLDDAPALNTPPRPEEDQVVNILGGQYKGKNGRVVTAMEDDTDSFLVQVRVSATETRDVTVPAELLWMLDPDDKRTRDSVIEGERLEREQVIGGAGVAAAGGKHDEDDSSSSSSEEELAVPSQRDAPAEHEDDEDGEEEGDEPEEDE